MYNICTTNKILKVNSDNYSTLTKGERYEIYCENGGGYFIYDDYGYNVYDIFSLTEDGLKCMDDCEILDGADDEVEDEVDEDEGVKDEAKPPQNNYSNVVTNSVFNVNTISNEAITSLAKALEANSLAILEIAKHLKADIQAPIIDFGAK